MLEVVGVYIALVLLISTVAFVSFSLGRGVGREEKISKK